MPDRICADCYGCLSWDRITGTCAKGILSVPWAHCHGLNPIQEPEPCERETGMLFTEVDEP